MDEQEFRRLLDMFPIIRPRDYHIESDPSRQSSSSRLGHGIESYVSRHSTSTSGPSEVIKKWQDAWEGEDENEKENQAIDVNDPFWKKLKLAAEKKLGAAEAERFCMAFQEVHRKLVYEDLSLDAARDFLKKSKGLRA
ncbi:hypothetical protein K2173_023518 [Erythroxylum novogranatense]|uniref:Uncharacterized protein n=1 Tax=Erythroxylum novogranatense TaxID=1862640 RepID=A0AAV8TRT7_9ROSI|nr:hypothetical protein K2173_023518 [Erythroxylum novogranatense]